MKNFSLNFSDLRITDDVVIRELGYNEEASIDERVIKMVESVSSEISAITSPLCAFNIFNGKIEPEEIKLNSSQSLHTGSVITYLLKGSERFALFVATSGKEFQQYFDGLKIKSDMVELFIADAIGSLIAERAGDAMERLLEKETGNKKHTNRFSPGYCGWHLSGQRQLFSLMDETPCGITLSEVCLMNPVKSISGIIGIGDEVNEKIYGCHFCEMESCYKRKNKNTIWSK